MSTERGERVTSLMPVGAHAMFGRAREAFPYGPDDAAAFWFGVGFGAGMEGRQVPLDAFRVSDYDRRPENVADIMTGPNSAPWSFSQLILRLCRGADADNIERLRQAFPDHVAVFEQWYLSAYPGSR